VRRLAALAITMALAWFVVVRLGGGGAGETALALGVALLAASVVGWLFQFLHLPRITGYLVFGILCGPSVANILTLSMARDLRVANGLALAILAFIAGLQIDFARLRPKLSGMLGFGAATILLMWVGLGLALYALWPSLPMGGSLTGSERAAAAALAAVVLGGFSPALTVAVITESRARGPLADLAVVVVVLSELSAVVCFAVCVDVTRAVFDMAPAGQQGIVASTLWELFTSLAFGAIVGSLFVLYLRYIGREVTLVLLALCAVLSGLGAWLNFAPLLAGLAAGLVVQNVAAPAGNVLRDAIERDAMPVLVLFFAAAGASIQVDAVSRVGLVALGVASVRLILVRAATWIAAAPSWSAAAPEKHTLWRALLPMPALATAMAGVVAADHPEWGASLQDVVFAVVGTYALIGPIVFRTALVRAGEIGRSDGGLIVVSNREPWIHEYAEDGSIRARQTPGGVSVALDALMRDRHGTWIAHGAGSADGRVVDEQSAVEVPPDAPAYRLRRLWLTPKEEEGYYAGFSNSALWPLCHQAHVRPVFRAEDWEVYQAVNKRFADVVAVEAAPDSSVFLNDYHLSLVAKYLRARRPLLRTALFWHIPWPDVDRLRICPWRKEIVEGLLSNDLLAFQLPRDRQHFLQAVAAELGTSISGGEVVYLGDRSVRVVAIPIGADFDRISAILSDESLPVTLRRLSQELGLEGKVVGIGVDRLDYTKGIPERIAAIDRVLESRPDLAERFVFVQIGVPSREEVPGYAAISVEIDDLVARVNAKHARGPGSEPITYLKRSFALPELVALYRLANFCIVSSLHDGMNLVAKEFVAARDDLDGVLILSELAGAAQELSEALIINPYDERGFVAAITRALEMPGWERRRRMQALRRHVAGRDVLGWASDILDRLERRKGLGFLSG
jgi:trehalose 6-phosphate synthase